MCVYHIGFFTSALRAFDTLAKALTATDSSSPPSLSDGLDTSGGGSIHVISRDQSTPIIEVEGPLLSDTHVTFKVSALGRWHFLALRLLGEGLCHSLSVTSSHTHADAPSGHHHF